MNLLRISIAALAVMTFAFAGCGDTTTDGKKKDDGKSAKKDDHGHDHEHKHGPNGGSHFTFKGNEDFAAEVVTYGENDLVKVMFCDHEGGKGMSLKAEKLSLTRTSGDEDKSFELEAIKAAEEGMVDGFELEDKALKVAVTVDAVKVTATIDGKEYTGTAYPHNH